MADPKIELSQLLHVKDWTADLADELKRTGILPCKNAERLVDCIVRQSRFLTPDMKPNKMCSRCKCRWHIMMALHFMEVVYFAKTDKVIDALPEF